MQSSVANFLAVSCVSFGDLRQRRLEGDFRFQMWNMLCVGEFSAFGEIELESSKWHRDIFVSILAAQLCVARNSCSMVDKLQSVTNASCN